MEDFSSIMGEEWGINYIFSNYSGIKASLGMGSHIV